jgi:hypothetical protein
MVDNYYKNDWKSKAEQLTKKKLLVTTQKEALESMIDSPDEENLTLAKELLRLKISEALIEGLNEGQTGAFVSIVDYFRDGAEYAGVVLKGYAGTGK